MKYHWFILFALCACANPVVPTGGPKDLDPPILLNTIPENKSLNFNGTEIFLEFDEYMKEENLLTQLMITPNLKGQYTFKLNRNTILLKFDQPFDSATTYTLNFREGLKDITEGNVPPNMKFVFSTGSYLDSASVNGTARSLMTKKLLEDITISLYRYPDTVTIFDNPPRYSTVTDKDGTFNIENIKNGNYSIFALNDENRNLKLETRTEGYGFLDQSLVMEDSLPAVELFIFNLDTRPIILQSSRASGRNYDIKFNKTVAKYQLATDSHNLSSNLVEENQTLRIYHSESIVDSLGLQFIVQDSLQQTLDTLVYVKFAESTRKPDKFTVSLEPRNGEINKNWTASISMNKPVSFINYDSIYFKFDSLYNIPLTDSLFLANYSNSKYELKFDFKSYLSEDSIFSTWSAPFEFIIAKGSIISAENDSIEEIRREYSFKDPKDFGILRGIISTEFSNYYIQLLNKSFDVVEEISVVSSTPYSYEFSNIEPGIYSIRILIDENANGTWDPGNINNNDLPEKVMLFFHSNVGSKEINLRANWEQSGLDIDF